MNDGSDQTLALSAGAFGRSFGEVMAECDFIDGQWQSVAVHALRPLTLHPGTHALHYASTCFEGIKAFRHAGGGLHVFRMERHIARFQATAQGLHLPVPPSEKLSGMLSEVVRQNARAVPEPPGALYLRPTLFGTDVNVGGVTEPSLNARVMVLACPVREYFSAPEGTFTLQIVDRQRAVRGIAGIKAGANYASALAPIMAGRREAGANQVLFCPDGDVQETGTSNFFLINDKTLLTKPVDDQFLPGITRDSLLQLADEMGFAVSERNFDVKTLLEWIRGGEAALCGTAAVLTPVATIVHEGRRYAVNDGRGQPHTARLKEALLDIQFGRAADRHGWLSADLRDRG